MLKKKNQTLTLSKVRMSIRIRCRCVLYHSIISSVMNICARPVSWIVERFYFVRISLVFPRLVFYQMLRIVSLKKVCNLPCCRKTSEICWLLTMLSFAYRRCIAKPVPFCFICIHQYPWISLSPFVMHENFASYSFLFPGTIWEYRIEFFIRP